MIEQTSRRRDEDVDALTQLRDLWLDADAAEHDHRPDRHVFAVGANGLFDLRRELARRRKNQAARPAGTGRVVRGRGGEQPVQDGQHEPRCLSCSGLCGGEQIAACEHDRDCFHLNGRGDGIAGVIDRAQQRLRQPKAGKLCFGSHYSSSDSLSLELRDTNRGRRIGDYREPAGPVR